jgi:hypothetical protein
MASTESEANEPEDEDDHCDEPEQVKGEAQAPEQQDQ